GLSRPIVTFDAAVEGRKVRLDPDDFGRRQPSQLAELINTELVQPTLETITDAAYLLQFVDVFRRQLEQAARLRHRRSRGGRAFRLGRTLRCRLQFAQL